ncbi:phage tail tape measure protein [Methyloligella sp. 2.7D]|uniref:phage tail tape measure protein n=1 Tax=unclassified Methyloligella TaxID=2625955 RepID=UPI00157DCC3F|nr:phage tail tape measure protein [Methyloligella sp. GL2]QKP77119.1 phage tail tape measure protein [Methyloligella sp. GL2]
MAEADDGLVVVISGDIAPLRSSLAEASRLSHNFAGDLTRAFDDAAVKGRTLNETLQRLVASLSSHTLEAALSPLSNAFGDALTGLLGTAGVGSLPVPFAKGGVIASPIAFPLSGSQAGIAGEAGPEAIMPLSRGADGRLGVKAQGGAAPVNITFNVTTPDAESFKRSQGQIAAMLSRTVARGSRNL